MAMAINEFTKHRASFCGLQRDNPDRQAMITSADRIFLCCELSLEQRISFFGEYSNKVIFIPELQYPGDQWGNPDHPKLKELAKKLAVIYLKNLK